ncbi:MAG: hypothetical protein NUV52_02635 [Candidatus Roizmanbacteria bacterium]|nr:hypothetical protein [Candidatus Roizmanbacteria bacterium]
MDHSIQILKQRSSLNHGLRNFLEKHAYIEVDAPVLVPSVIPESYLEAFSTTFIAPHMKPVPAYLTASPEAYLKRLLSMGIKSNLFYLGKAFRNNEPLDGVHNHEFTMLEWYRLSSDYEAFMTETESLLKSVMPPLYSGKPWERISMEEAFTQFVPSNELQGNTFDTLSSDRFSQLYVQYLEPNMGTRGTPTFLMDFPAMQSPLSASINGIAQRFELYLNGIELVNGCAELGDGTLLEQNLAEEVRIRQQLHKNPITPDQGFVDAMKKGIPPCCGAAMGIDRLLMVIGGYAKLSDVILFPSSTLFS